jgi:hypothetical protein
VRANTVSRPYELSGAVTAAKFPMAKLHCLRGAHATRAIPATPPEL